MGLFSIFKRDPVEDWIIKEFGQANDNGTVRTVAHRIIDGSADAMADLAVFYEHGCHEIGIVPNVDRCYYWYGEAAKRGHVEASYYYGTYLLAISNEGSILQYVREGMYYIEYAADSGFAKAQYKMGIAYLYGMGVEQSEEEALKYLTKAKDNGNEEALELLRKESNNETDHFKTVDVVI